MCIINKIGPPVVGDNFYGREAELKKANRLLDSGHSLLLSAPRRIGKSSLAKKLLEEKTAQGWKCVYIDLEETFSEDGFLELIIDEFSKGQVWRQVTGGLSKEVKAILDRIGKISIGPIGIDLKTTEDREDLYSSLRSLLRHDENTLVVVDELTLFLNSFLRSEDGENKVSFILNWLRSIRQIADTQIRWLFCGSVGLKNFTSSLNLSYTINDLANFSLDELTREEARGLMKGLCKGEDIIMEEDIIEYALDKIYWNIPYFIQVLFSKVSENYDGHVSRKDIDNAYTMLCSDTYLGTWSERLAEYREYEFPARQVLKALSSRKAGLSRNTLMSVLMEGVQMSEYDKTDLLLSHVLEMLENDGYIIRKGSVRAFRSPLLRDFWYAKFIQ